MIVAFQPGGTIRSARVILRPDELVPLRYNVREAVIYREDAETGEWVVVKPLDSVLPSGSPLLSELKIPTTFPLTEEKKGGSLYEHEDIIRLDESSKDSSADGDTDGINGSRLVS